MEELTLQSTSKMNVVSTPRTVLLLKLGLVVLLATLWCGTPVSGQSACSLVAPGTLCLDQPQSGDTKISGQADKGSVDIKVNETVYRNVKVINHKFSKTVPALGADLTVMATTSGTAFTPPGLLVFGHGLCEANSKTVCLENPVIGESDVTVDLGASDIAADSYKLILNKNTAQAQTTWVPETKAKGSLAVAVRKLTQYDLIELDDAAGNLVAGPLMTQTTKSPPTCSAKSAKLPCLKPVKSTDKSVTGFATPGSEIEIDVNKINKGKPPVDAKTGAFTLEQSSLAKGQTITATQTGPAPAGSKAVSTTVADTPAPDSTIALYTLGLAGINVAGSSDSGPTQQYFVSFDTRLPLPFLGKRACASPQEDYVMDYKCWVWFNPRIASAPAPSSSTLKSFSSAASLTSGIGGETLGQITQTVEFHSGMEYTLFHGPRVPTSNTAAFRGGFSVIFAGGIVTPINSTSSASIFALNNNLGNQFTENSLLPSYSGKTFAETYPVLASALCGHFGFTSTPACTPSTVAYGNVAFVLPNRSRFYRDYSVGIRLRTYFFSGDCTHKAVSAIDQTATSCKAANIYPGTFDIRIGQDETVTGGYFRGLVMTTTASYPLPGTGGTIRIFGSTYLSMNRNKNMPVLALLAASSTIPITDPSVVVQPIVPSDHDYYRIGIGADLIPIISKWMNPKSSSSSPSTSTPSQ